LRKRKRKKERKKKKRSSSNGSVVGPRTWAWRRLAARLPMPLVRKEKEK